MICWQPWRKFSWDRLFMDLQSPLFSSPIMQVYKVNKNFALTKVFGPSINSTEYQVFWFCCGKFGYTPVVLLSYHHDAKLRWKWSRDCCKIEARFAANIKKWCFILADLRFCYIQICTCSSTGMFRSLLSLPLSLHGWFDHFLKENYISIFVTLLCLN